MLAEYPLIQKEAFLYFPSEQQIVERREDKTVRIIFDGGLDFTSFQKEKLANLQFDLAKQKKNQHLSFFSQSFLLRFLQATKYDNEDCIKALKQYKKWQDGILPLSLKPEVQKLLTQGMFYLVGRDNHFRPIIVVNVGRILDIDPKEKLFFQALGFFFQYVIENCLIEGQVQTWITIIDLCDASIFSVGGTLKSTISFLSDRFRCRLHHSYLVNCPSSIKFLWSMIKGALNQDQLRKLTLKEESNLPRDAFKEIYPQDIEVKYGGNCKNYTSFWPITIKQRVFTASNCPKIITEEEYNEFHLKGQLRNKKINKNIIQKFEEKQRSMSPFLPIFESAAEINSSNLQETEEKNRDLVFQNEDLPYDLPQLPSPVNFFQLFTSGRA